MLSRRLACLTPWLVAASAAAQPLADLNELALRFTRGEWVSPLVCEHETRALRGLRRVLVTAGPRDARPPANKLAFVPMQLPAGARCSSDTGEAQPDVGGSLLFHLEGISRPDLATRLFQEALERDGGFTFAVRSGVLQVDGRKVDFGKGTARFERVRRGSDAWRRLGDFDVPQKLTLSLAAPDGTRLAVDLALAQPR